MKHNLFLLIFSICTSLSYSQNTCLIENEFGTIFKAEKKTFGEREYLYQTVNEINTNSCFSELVKNNKTYINYLRQHFTQNINQEELLAIANPEELQLTYTKALKNDTNFTKLMKELAGTVKEENTVVKDTVSLDEILDVAVKYFSIKGITPEGYYEGKVCAGINGIKQTLDIRRPHLEAFCFSTILDHLKDETFNMYNEFVKGIKELYTLNLGMDNSEKLLRAQGAMFMFMRNNKKLSELLQTEYENKKGSLPFILKIK
ncbi:hypothetical protein [Winogradskyella aurantia]|uniref:Uncharacterized protein n=1 Tax=Winogradskyella aurantia TaxID=1915063 RepID=A0A265UU70_9FLAO|nr:hypothetical protein [Winogradskyella aurantia]OZV68617.1 hypothetical protein CA834_09105 [Winogradskyella aurantia]